MNQTLQRVLAPFLLAIVIVGCSKSERELATSTPDSSSEGNILVEMNNQPIESDPNPTRVVPVPTFTLVPTFTPVPAVTDSSPPTSTPAVEIRLERKGDFGTDRNPLTGELVNDPTTLLRRPIAIKISNAPAKYTRPQSGLSSADLVFEHVTEGSITRFTAILYGETPEDLGPIRSARLIDLDIPVMYDSALAYSGSSIGVSRKLFSSDFSSRILRPHEAGYYRTGEAKPYEHTLYAHPEEFWDVLAEKDENRPPEFNSTMTFASKPPEGGIGTSSVTIQYRKFSTIDWKYDPDNNIYLRWADGELHLDANNGEQLSASNVVIIYAPHQLDLSICEYQSGNECLAHSMQIGLNGEGPAVVLRDGQRYEMNWRRPKANEMITLVDELGLPFPLQIGKTWFQIMPPDYPAPIFLDR